MSTPTRTPTRRQGRPAQFLALRRCARRLPTDAKQPKSWQRPGLRTTVRRLSTFRSTELAMPRTSTRLPKHVRPSRCALGRIRRSGTRVGGSEDGDQPPAIPVQPTRHVRSLRRLADRRNRDETFRWGDVDVDGLRLRLPKSATKRDRARWLYLPQWLMNALEDTCPLEDRVAGRKVFLGITEASAYQAMTRACRNAKVPALPPARPSPSPHHDLAPVRRPPARELAERAGHARASMSLDVYSHVMPPDEVESERVLSLLMNEGT